MNKHNEQIATNGDLADRNQKQKMVLAASVSSLSKSDATDKSNRMVHAFTLHARSNIETRASKPIPASFIAGASTTANAPPQVRYKKNLACPGAFQIGNTFDMAGQLG